MTLRTIWFFILIRTIIGATLINCPKNAIKFEKILGLKPSDSNHPLLLYKSDTSTPVTQKCLTECASKGDCRSFVIYYNISTCYWFKSAIQGVQEAGNVLDTNTAWFVKNCYENVDKCEKAWIFERAPGAILIGNDTKTLPEILTRTDCQQHCLNETDFICRSVKFKIRDSEYGPNDETKGVCVLSDANRWLLTNSFRASGYDEEYFENQCAQDVPENLNEFCAYEEYDNSLLAHSDEVYEDKNKDECQQLCQKNTFFNCRGFSLVVRNQKFDCYLHSEDSKIHGPRLIRENPMGFYYEKAQCINISIICTETYMTMNYSPEVDFTGRVYMDGYSEQPECFAIGRGTNLVTLKLPLLASQCGIIRADAPANRTLMIGTMILQYNALIQTQGDRTIRIGCIFGNDSKVLVGTGITITTAPNIGSTLINSTGTVTTPIVAMRVVDLETQEEISSTQIGQELQLIIEMKEPHDDLDIWAGHLVAMTEKNDESILLLNDKGCPTNLNIFPALTKLNHTKKLVANFQAFKFSSSPIVKFSVIVQFCKEKCPPIDCGAEGLSYGKRKRRQIQSRSLETINGTTILKVNRSDFEGNATKADVMPLEYVMLVKGPVNSDRLVVNDGKVLVAGYDYSTNEVCLDYSLFIGLTLVWIVAQIVFVTCGIVLVRRYKKHYETETTRQSLEELNKNFGIGFSNLDGRRVHWADNGALT